MRSCAGIPATDRAVAAAVPLIQSAVLLAMRPVTGLEPILVMNVVVIEVVVCSVAVACAIPAAIPAATVDTAAMVAMSAMSMRPAAVDIAGADRPVAMVAMVAVAATAVVACDVPADTDRPTVPAVRLLSSRAIAAARCRPAVEPPTVMP